MKTWRDSPIKRMQVDFIKKRYDGRIPKTAGEAEKLISELLECEKKW